MSWIKDLNTIAVKVARAPENLRISRVLLISVILNVIDVLFLQPKVKKIILKSFHDEINMHFTILDVGANVGQSIKFFPKILPHYEIASFEPNPDLILILQNSGFKNVRLFQLALSDFIGKSIFYISPLHLTSSLRYPNVNSSFHKTKSKILGIHPLEMYRPIEVEVETIDNVFQKNNQKIIFLKIDVEGAEFQVLLGAKNLIAQNALKVIQIEKHPNDLREDSSREISDYLSKFGYEHFKSVKHLFGNVSEEFYRI